MSNSTHKKEWKSVAHINKQCCILQSNGKNLRNRIDVRLENQDQAACHKKYLTII